MELRAQSGWFPVEPFQLGKRIAVLGIVGSGLLAVLNIVTGVLARSTSVTAIGVEFAGDVLASAVVLFGMMVASRPPDENHPYGHGRSEMLAGLLVGLILLLAGLGICVRSLQAIGNVHEPPSGYGVWPLILAIVVKGILTGVKFRFGRRIQSASLVADAWNDAVDILSALAALTALGLTLLNPARFLDADHFGGFTVGLIVIFTGFRVVRDTSLQLMDTMPNESLMAAIRDAALSVPGALGVEKCYARKTGLQYHVDLHLEVDPNLSVQASHEIATLVRFRIREKLPTVADVLVHVEPAPSTTCSPMAN
ncbi:MAG: cation transporter [Acidobacteria bacterium]|nr:cation transporter [Acidobacteriota bacterium]